jgi:protein SCO1/2
VTEAVGFKYRWDEEQKQFMHAAAIYVLTPEGKISRYLYGVDFDPQTLKMSLMEAAGGKIGTPLDQIILYCYHYNPQSGTYSLAALRIMQLGGILTVIVLGSILSALWVRGRRASA